MLFFNEHIGVLMHKAHPPRSSIVCCLVQKSSSVNLKPLVGDQMETILQIIEECLISLAHPDDLACWRAHVNLVELLRKPSFSESDLADLTMAIDDFKSRFHQVHADVCDVIRTRKDGVATSVSKLLNLQFPNFGVLEHWPDQIRFLGAPSFQSTKVWEHRHLDSKRCCHNTNQKEFERDVMIRVRSLMSQSPLSSYRFAAVAEFIDLCSMWLLHSR